MPHPHRPQHLTHSHHSPRVGNMSAQNLHGDQYEADFFALDFAFGSIATLVTSTLSVNVQADSAFLWEQTTVVGNKNGEAEPWVSGRQFPFTVFLTDTGTGRQLMNVPVPLTNWAGRGDLPFILPQPRIFMPKATINMQLVSFSASTWDNVHVTLLGKKLFEYGRAS